MIRKFCDVCGAPAVAFPRVGKGVLVHRGNLQFDLPHAHVLDTFDKKGNVRVPQEKLDLCQDCLEGIIVEFMDKALQKRWVRKDSLDKGAAPGVDSGATKGPHESDPPLPLLPPVS